MKKVYVLLIVVVSAMSFVACSSGTQTSESVATTVHEAGSEAVSDVKSVLSTHADSLENEAKRAINSTTNEVQDGVDKAKDAAKSGFDNAKDAAKKGADNVVDKSKGVIQDAKKEIKSASDKLK